MAKKLSVNEALNRTRAMVDPLPVQTISIDTHVYGCVTADTVPVAPETRRFDCAAMLWREARIPGVFRSATRSICEGPEIELLIEC
ncbi:hypothetical protein [Sphingopyxis witflariensis]|uniref:Uncharacterized protein n=1 Tax=Sphingopyxis witflariensis TaxID=173675 RepID=A0A246K5X1_9SPHN|nr:hypothetical protein [Sphingopyxis witflariensis]OWR01383.1 hypothetical protein CDQ91_03030 [Sphingopyxis witflariensis]